MDIISLNLLWLSQVGVVSCYAMIPGEVVFTWCVVRGSKVERSSRVCVFVCICVCVHVCVDVSMCMRVCVCV